MDNSTLKNLLKEYEQKRMDAYFALDKKVAKLYEDNPRLEELDSKLNNVAISTAQSIISGVNSDNSLDNLQIEINELKSEKQKILKSLGICEDFFKPKFDCQYCEDTGYINDGYNSSLCNCIKQKLFDIEYNKSNINNISKENFDTFNINIYSNEVNEKAYNSNISPKENILNIKDIALLFVKNFDDPNEKNLLFTGNTGLGKTFLSNCIANELLKNGKTVLYQTAPIMLDTIIDYRFGKSNISKNVYDNFLDVDLLIIDDLGTECMNSMKFSELFNIINTRILNQNNHITKTIISTNLNLKNLSQTYDERIFSRFVGYYNICRFFGDDLRFKK